MQSQELRRTLEQWRAYINAVVRPDLLSGGEVAKRHTLKKIISREAGGKRRAVANVAYIADVPVIWCPLEEK